MSCSALAPKRVVAGRTLWAGRRNAPHRPGLRYNKGMVYRIVVVEDDRKTADLLRLYLERDGHQVAIAYDGREGLDLIRRRPPDLVLLDLMLPSLDGLDICRTLRAEWPPPGLPIIMLTAKASEEDTLLGLELGADDYITKPFSPREVVARVRTVLRRTHAGRPLELETLHYGPLTIHLLRHEVTLDNQPVPLTPKEFNLLAVMARQPGRAFSRSELVEKAFGYNYAGFDRTVDVHIANLRRKLEGNTVTPRFVHTLHGVGYKFDFDNSTAGQEPG